MITKNQIIDVIQAMPENEFIDAEPVIEEILLLEKIKKGLDSAEKKDIVSDDEVDKLIEQW